MNDRSRALSPEALPRPGEVALLTAIDAVPGTRRVTRCGCRSGRHEQRAASAIPACGDQWPRSKRTRRKASSVIPLPNAVAEASSSLGGCSRSSKSRVPLPAR